MNFLELVHRSELESKFGELCEPVSDITDDIVKLCHNLAQIMYDHEGIGISAPQVGVNKRIVIIDCSENQNKAIYLINPEILWQSPQESQKLEGCLSYPGLFLPIKRPNKIKVKALDLEGKNIEFEATGMYARCIYHEIDHLNGLPFTHRTSRQVRRHLMRKWIKNNGE